MGVPQFNGYLSREPPLTRLVRSLAGGFWEIMGANSGVSCLGRNLFRPHFSCVTLGLSLLVCKMGIRIGLTSWGEGSSQLKPVRYPEQCSGYCKCYVSVHGSEYALTSPTFSHKPKYPRERRGKDILAAWPCSLREVSMGLQITSHPRCDFQVAED